MSHYGLWCSGHSSRVRPLLGNEDSGDEAGEEGVGAAGMCVSRAPAPPRGGHHSPRPEELACTDASAAAGSHDCVALEVSE
eukprot:760141-Prymnesium_polylepis.1